MPEIEPYTPPVDSWVRWITPSFSREGQVVWTQPPGMKIRWLGEYTDQIFPWAWVHFGEHADMELIEKPAAADRIERERSEGRVGITEAAARMGTTPKRIRQKLRDGKLPGVQQDGRWTHVIF